ncbi:MAG TPA: DNA-J related domain-containing protein, partial [Pseudomonas sp.]|nr:DNA-J related domain-containing protein [Pseudomonas sp.]
MNDLDPALDLAEQLHELLRAAPAGISEFHLIQQLKARHSTHIPNLGLADKLVLFRTHFLLFNALYVLRDRLWHSQAAHLEISPLCVQ